MRKIILVILVILLTLGLGCPAFANRRGLVKESCFDYGIHYNGLPEVREYFVYKTDFEIVDGIMYLDKYYRIAYGSVVEVNTSVITSEFTLWDIEDYLNNNYIGWK